MIITMTLAEKYCLTAAFVFLMAGLFSGLWKYQLMMSSNDGKSRYYVDTAHRAALMYAFAALVLGQLAKYSAFPALINEVAVIAPLFFFGTAIASYLFHGFLNDTTNQIQHSKTGAHGAMPLWATRLSMTCLIIAEIGGTGTLGIGALQTIWR